MVDNLSVEARSALMGRIKSGGTKPEQAVRRAVHALGLRFRLHRRDLPGTPDLVFPKHRAVVFVHGCFWHAHSCKRGGRIPKSNADYWAAKIGRNVERDALVRERLRTLGWRSMVVWECETKNPADIAIEIATFVTEGRTE